MTGFVYAIQAGEAIKIGWTTDPVRRLSELNVAALGLLNRIAEVTGGAITPNDFLTHAGAHASEVAE